MSENKESQESQGSDETVDEPVLDGADETFSGDEDPRKGQEDPALIRHPDKGDKNRAPYNL